MGLKIILTGATGYVGEGVLLECLSHEAVEVVLVVGRRSCGRQHAKLQELLLPDFRDLILVKDQLAGYDGCFFCAGVTSLGKGEEEYTRLTYDTTLAFARAVHASSPQATFNYVSGAGTNINGRQMWARVKGRTELELSDLGFRQQFNFRPGLMTLTPGMRNPKRWMRAMVPVFAVLMPWVSCSLKQVGLAMIHAVQDGYPKNVLEVKDIKELARTTVPS